jgi:DNA-binding response OmpR family regulator
VSQKQNEKDQQKWVLIVEDDKDLSGLIADLLRLRGLEVLEASGSFEALGLVLGQKKGEIGAILTDIHMPEGSGVELVNALHLLKSGIPVYLMTGDPAFDSVRAISLGARGVFQKPFAPKIAVETIVAVLNRNYLRVAAGF